MVLRESLSLLLVIAMHEFAPDYSVQYLENIGLAMEHSDWSILVISPLTALVM